MYKQIETILKNKLDELTLLEDINIITSGKVNSPSIYISMGDVNYTSERNENFGTILREGNLGVTLFIDLKAKSGIKDIVYTWIDRIEKKINELEQTEITGTGYEVSIFEWKIINIMPRYDSPMEAFIIIELSINLQKYWS
jgi:hypothetical protein